MEPKFRTTETRSSIGKAELSDEGLSTSLHQKGHVWFEDLSLE